MLSVEKQYASEGFDDSASSDRTLVVDDNHGHVQGQVDAAQLYRGELNATMAKCDAWFLLLTPPDMV